MKINKHFTHTVLGTFVLGLLAVGCADDFTEEDLLNKNVELAEQQDIDKAVRAAEALNTAGEMLSYSVKVVTNSNEPVAGANVTLQAAAQTGAEFDTQTITTDANGQAFFPRAVIGGNILTIAADGFFDVTASVDFGTIDEGEHYQIIEGEIVPTPVTESSIVPLFSDASGDEVATISGVVSIESDMTNTTPEVPQDLTLRANLSNFASQFNELGSVNLQIYTFDDDLTIGSAVVDNATGAYSMTVPSTPDGIYVEVLVPDVSVNQRVAINSRNNQPLDRPEYADVPTNFGPTWGSDFDVPYVPGAVWVFDQPSETGAGFDFTYERLGRSLTTGTFNMDNYLVPGEIFGGGIDDIIVRVDNLGSGYIASPSLTITDPTGSAAAAQAHIEFAVDGLTLTTSGSADFPADTPIGFDLVFDQVNNVLVDGVIEQQVIENVIWDFDFLTVLSTDLGGGVGEITQTAVDNALADAIANDVFGFDPSNLYSINRYITNLRIVTDEGVMQEAVIHITSTAVGQVYQFGITEAGFGYTSPSFTFSGGGDNATQANIEVQQFGTRWIMTPDNSGITVPYTTLPTDIDYEYISVNTGTQFPSTDDEISDADFDNDTDILSNLEVDADGNIQFKDQVTELFATDNRSHVMPRTLIEEPESYAARYVVDDIDVDTNGGITDYDFDSTDQGQGYTGQFMVTVLPAAEGAPGSGAQVDLTGGALTTSGEYEWYGGYSIKSFGADYLENLNQQNSQGYSGYFEQTIYAGQDYFFNIQYGTGVKQEDVD